MRLACLFLLSHRACGLAVALGLAAAGLANGCTPAQEPPDAELHSEPTLVDGVSLRLVGVPDRRLMPTNATILDPDAGLEATVLQGTHNLTFGRAIRFQPTTGQTDILFQPGSSGAWSLLPLEGGEAYLGGHQNGWLFHLAPGDTALRRIPVPNSESWIFSLARGSDGNVYLGTYPEGHLLRYDPRTGVLDDLGPVIPSDGRAVYLRGLTGAFPGKLYAGMGAQAELLEIDLATGESTPMLPSAFHDRSFVNTVDRIGDWLVAIVAPEDQILLFDPNTRTLERVIVPPTDGGIWRHNRNSVFLHDGEVYFGTMDDDALWAYDLTTETTRLVGEGLGGPFGLTADRYLFTRDYFNTYRIYDLAVDRVIVERPTRFEGAGMEIHALAEGPGATVVGGIYINQGFFEYDPVADTLFAPGAAVSFGGQIDHLATHDALVYLAHYTSARLTVYDPSQPWRPGRGDGANPRLVGRAGQSQDRFPTAVFGSDGRLYLGSIPKYGVLGGALVVYDPATETLTTHRNVVSGQSVYALVETGGVLYGGTAVKGGLGSQPTATEAKLFSWDLSAQQKRMERTVVPGARELWGLDRLPDGRLVGGADSTLFVYDPAADAVLATRTAVPEVITRLVASRDGWVYGLTEERFFRATPDLQTVETLDVNPDYWDSLVETSAGRLFVGRGAGFYEVVRED